MYTTVRVDDIVIADVVPAEALVVAADALHGAVGIRMGGGAMEDDFGDLSHCLMGFMGLMGFSLDLIYFSGAQGHSLRSGRYRRGGCFAAAKAAGAGRSFSLGLQ